MCTAKDFLVDKAVVRLLKRLPARIKDRLIEVAVAALGWGCVHFPWLKRAVVREITSVGDTWLGIRAEIAWDYVRGAGIEIGALHEPTKLPQGVRALYVDKFPTNVLMSHHPELSDRELVNVDIVDDGESLQKISDESQDFVIANHFLEHCQDPISTVGNMVRVLRQDGILYLALPDKRFTFDLDRPVTPIEHVLTDHQCGPQGSRKDHFEEWFRLVRKIEDDAEREKAIAEGDESQDLIHYHVWTQTGMLELIATLQRSYDLELELMRKNGIEVIFVLRKQAIPTSR